MIVPDASAVLELVLRTHAAPEIERRVLQQGVTLHCPHLLDLEVAQVLRRYVLAKEVSEPRARQALEDLEALALTRYSHVLFLDRIWELHVNLTAYDASYVALAEALGATLLTSDARLASAPGHQAKVELVAPR